MRLFCLIFVMVLVASPGMARKKIKKAKSVTEIDFEGSLLEGKMKAPSGFFLTGRKSQSLKSMIKLRSNFKTRIKKSRNSLKAAVK